MGDDQITIGSARLSSARLGLAWRRGRGNDRVGWFFKEWLVECFDGTTQYIGLDTRLLVVWNVVELGSAISRGRTSSKRKPWWGIDEPTVRL